MSEIEVMVSKKERRRARSREQAAEVTEIDSSDTPANFSAESLLEMSSNFSSPQSAKAIARLGDFQI